VSNRLMSPPPDGGDPDGVGFGGGTPDSNSQLSIPQGDDAGAWQPIGGVAGALVEKVARLRAERARRAARQGRRP